MNKKFSTLVAGVLLAASVGTVNAASPVYAKSAAAVDAATKILADKYYQLQVGASGTNVIGMYPASPVDGTYTLKQVDLAAGGGQELRYTLWKIEASQNTEDGYRYAFVNLGTGQTLSYDPAMAIAVDATPNTVDVAAATATAASKVGGTVALWKWVASPAPTSATFTEDILTSVFKSATGKDSVVTMALDGDDVVAVKYALANLPTASTLEIRPAQAQATLLGVDDLNSMLWNADPAVAGSKLKLTFDKDVQNATDGNVFTQELKAERAIGFPFNNYQWATPGTAAALTTTALAAYDKAQHEEAFASAIKAAIGSTVGNIDKANTYLTGFSASIATDYATALAAANALTVATGDDKALQTALKNAVIAYVKSEKVTAGTIANLKTAYDAIVAAIATTPTTVAGVATAVNTYVEATKTAKTAAEAEAAVAGNVNAIDAQGWVSLKTSKGNYVMVDTTYLTKAAGEKHLKIVDTKKFADLTYNSSKEGLGVTDKTRLDINGRFNFQFVYHPYQDSIVIRSAGYAMLSDGGAPATPIFKDLDLSGLAAPAATATTPAERNLIKIKVLADGHREVTVGNSEYDGKRLRLGVLYHQKS